MMMIASAIVLAFIIIFGLTGAVLHKMNIDTVYKRVKALSASIHLDEVQKGDTEEKKASEEKKMSEVEKKNNFKKFLYTPQGSTFDALALSSWLLFIVGTLFVFFLTPQISEEWTYLNLTYLVSSSLGFFSFGFMALVIGLIMVIMFRLTDVYSMYIIPKGLKRAIMASWVLLLAPLTIPAYLAVLYPYAEGVSDWIYLAFFCLIVSQILLLSPIFIKALGVRI